MKKKATRGGKLLLQRVTNGKIPEGETNLPFPILRSRSRDLFYDHRGENSRSLLLPQVSSLATGLWMERVLPYRREYSE
ncbi:uncharacterized protein LOC143215011 isoform X2 [Lasioglossum baleicum]|uniref:uncharacterized protein LOC143215011 isoform X2 n=1 Tax=Lasioglossum baleicum TaxID=434251 RepID=UPI003FCDEA5D